MKERKLAGIRAELANATRAQASRFVPLCNPAIPNTQVATKRVNAANHRLTALPGRASHTKAASAVKSTTRATSGTKGAVILTSVLCGQNHRDVCASQAMGVDQNCPNTSDTMNVRYIVEITLRIQLLIVDRWRNGLML
jgi:hypothetical protein